MRIFTITTTPSMPPPTLVGRIRRWVKSLFVDTDRELRDLCSYVVLVRTFNFCDTAEERMDLLSQAMECGVSRRVIEEALSAARPLPAAEAVALSLYREYERKEQA